MNNYRTLRHHPAAAIVAAALFVLLGPWTSAAAAAGHPISKVLGVNVQKAAAACTLPAPILSVTPSPIAFPPAYPNGSVSVPVTVSNGGSANLIIYDVSTSGPSCEGSVFDFVIDSCTGVVTPPPTFPITLPPGGTCSATAYFDAFCYTAFAAGPQSAKPGAPKSRALKTILANLSGSVDFLSNDPANPTLSVPMSSTVNEALQISPTSIDFGVIQMGSSSATSNVTVTNVSTVPLLLNSIFVPTGDFTGANVDCPVAPVPFAPGASCTLTAAFTPQSAWFFGDSISINYSDTTLPTPAFQSSSGVSLSGIGTAVGGGLNYGTAYVAGAAGQVTGPSTVTIFNLESTAQTIPAISVPTSPPVNVVSENCTAGPIPPGGSCDITISVDAAGMLANYAYVSIGSISFTPSVSSPASIPILLYLYDPAPPPTPSANLVFSPSFLDFPMGTKDVPSQLDVTVQNTGDAATGALTFTNPGGYPEIGVISPNGCEAGLAIGASCTITVTYSRASTTTGFAYLGYIGYTMSAQPLYGFPVYGFTVAAVPATLDVSPATLTFGTTLVGTDSLPVDISAGNTGDAPLGIASIVSSSPDFVVSSTCPLLSSQLAAKACCPVTVTFRPTAAGSSTGTLTFMGAAGPLKTVPLAGTGQAVVAPVVGKAFTPSSIVAGGVSNLDITISNANPAVLANAAFTDTFPAGLVVAPSPAATNTCGGTLTAAAGSTAVSLAGGAVPLGSVAPGTCTISVPVTAAAVSPGLVNTIPAGGFTSTLANSTADATATLIVTAAPTPAISVSPLSLNFGSQIVGTTSAGQSVIVTSVGTAPLTITGVTPSGDYLVSSTCLSSPLAPLATCVVSVQFKPILVGSRPGSIVITSDDPASPSKTVTLSGLGVAAPLPGITFQPASLTFPPTYVGNTAAPQLLTLSNTGGSPATILSIDVTGSAFTATNNCRNTLIPGGSCGITVRFTPGSNGRYGGSVRVTTNAPGSPHVAALSGTGIVEMIGRLSSAPSSLTFSDQVINTTSAPQSLTIRNDGNATATIRRISASGDFAFDGSCPSLVAGASCVLQVSFKPTQLGSRTGRILVESDASNASFTVNLSGSSVPIPAPHVTLSASSLGFGNNWLGTTATLPLTITNTGNADLLFAGISSGGEFGVTGSCPAVMAPAAACSVVVSFSPSVPGTRLGSVTVTSNANNNPTSAALSGVGCRIPSSPGNRAGDDGCGP